MANTVTKLITWLYGKKIGTDIFGNIYYESKKSTRISRRWVIYGNKDDEPTRVPPVYYAWLRHTITDFPKNYSQYKWQIPPNINQTGTKKAHILPGHLLLPKTNRAHSMSGDYQAWTPPK